MATTASQHHAIVSLQCVVIALATTAIPCSAQSAWRGSPTDPVESTLITSGDADARPAMTENRLLDLRLSLQPDEPAKVPEPEPSRNAEELAKELTNPLTSRISIPFQFNLDFGLGPKNAERLTLSFQPVVPFALSEDWSLITRSVVSFVYQGSLADGLNSNMGKGDMVQSFFLSPKKHVGGWFLAAGPIVLWPTGTNPVLRAEQFGLGPTALVVRQDQQWTYGMLANHIWGVTESDDHPDVSATSIQPLVAYTWPTATTLTLSTESTYDWTARQWTVPVNLTLSQIVNIGEQPVQIFFGGRYYAESPIEGQEWGIRFGFTLLFRR